MSNNSVITSALNSDKTWMQREVCVDTFSDFVKEIHSLLPNSQMKTAAYWWFRGQSNRNWDLKPSFLRVTGPLGLERNDAIELEEAAKREFRSKAHLYLAARLLDKVKTDPCWWAIMQHHGAPTRLLDWSRSPYVAAYFAAQQDGEGKDGPVWCFCSGQLKSTFETKYDGEFPDFTKTSDEDDDVEKLHDSLRNPEAPASVAPLIFPFMSSERIAQQQGAFTMCLRIHQTHNCISKQVGSDHIKKILIPHKSKPGFLAQLRYMNITASAMFPGIDGLGQSVAEFAALGAMHKEVCGLSVTS